MLLLFASLALGLMAFLIAGCSESADSGGGDHRTPEQHTSDKGSSHGCH
jgi:hypothetical protein